MLQHFRFCFVIYNFGVCRYISAITIQKLKTLPMEIELISVPRMRVAQLQSLAENTLTIGIRHSQLQVAVQKVHAELDGYKAGMLKHSASAAEKAELDKVRDRFATGLFHLIRSEECFPYESSEDKALMSHLTALNKKYSPAITRLPLDEKTASLDNLLSELQILDLSKIANGRIKVWVPLIQNANNKYKSAAQGYISESAETSGIPSASAKAPQLIGALNALYSTMYAHVQISGDVALLKSYNELQMLINAAK